MKNVNLYNQDGSLHPEAQLLMSFKSSNMSIGDWKKRMKAFKASLSSEDLEEFERLKIKELNAIQRAKKPIKIKQPKLIVVYQPINLYDENGKLQPEAQDLLFTEPTSKEERSHQLSVFRQRMSASDVADFEKIRTNMRYFKKVLKSYPVWFDKAFTKTSLYNNEGSLCDEARFLIFLRICTLPTKEERSEANLRLNHFENRLSAEDLKTFKKIKSREQDRMKQLRYRNNNSEKVREADRKRSAKNAPKWRAANPEKSKGCTDRYITKRAAKRFQERLEKYPEFYAGWVDEEKIDLYKSDGTLFCESIRLLITIKPEHMSQPDWTRIMKDFTSKLSFEDKKTFKKLRRLEMFSRNKKRERERSPIKFKLRKAVENAFNRIKKNKPARTLELLGCTWEEARLHIESLFQEGMTWENHGLGDDKWHIDHIRPVCSFEDHELHLMNHISNLRPLWQKDNFGKTKLDRKQSVKNKRKVVEVEDQALTNVASAPRPSLEAFPSVTS